MAYCTSTVLATLACVAPAVAQCEPQRFFPDFQPSPLEFGNDVRVSQDHLIIVDRFGLVYTYRKNPATGDWAFNHTVVGASGADLELDGNRFVTGSLGVERFGGAIVYEFDGEEWQEAGRLETPDDPTRRGMGESVTLHGDVAALGDGGDSVRVYRSDSEQWQEIAFLISPDSPTRGSDFGYAMHMNERFLFIGAPTEDITGEHDGAVYVYEWDDTGMPVLFQKLVAPGPFPEGGPRLGHALFVDGDTLVTSGWRFGPGCGGEGNPYGGVYVYDFDGSSWELTQVVTVPDPPCRGLKFGWDVCLEGDLLAVGARGDGKGTCHLYRRGSHGTWEHAKAVTLEGMGGIDYAEAVSLGGGQLAIGGSEGFTMGFDQGVADVFDLDCLLCAPDLDADGTLTIFDFLTFLNLFQDGSSEADFDGDGELTIFDFLAFQTAFDAGCE